MAKLAQAYIHLRAREVSEERLNEFGHETDRIAAEIAQRVEDLLARIRNRSALVGIVGLGYVGLPFAVEKAKVGFKVCGIDQNPEPCSLSPYNRHMVRRRVKRGLTRRRFLQSAAVLAAGVHSSGCLSRTGPRRSCWTSPATAR